MGVYIEIKLHNGEPLAKIEIRRAHDQEQPEHSMDYSQEGRYRYRFKAEVKNPVTRYYWHFEDSVEHERTEDVLALLKSVIERIQETQKEIG